MIQRHLPSHAAKTSPTTGAGASTPAHATTPGLRSVGQAAQSGGGIDEGPAEGDWMGEHVMKPTNDGPIGLPPSPASASNAANAIESKRGQQ